MDATQHVTPTDSHRPARRPQSLQMSKASASGLDPEAVHDMPDLEEPPASSPF
jgi:hypothetical protein